MLLYGKDCRFVGMLEEIGPAIPVRGNLTWYGDDLCNRSMEIIMVVALLTGFANVVVRARGCAHQQ